MTSQVVGSSIQGGEAGYKVGGVWGAVIGAAVGAVGGIFGDKAAKYRRKANSEEQRMADIKESVERRQLIRQAYLARGEALAASASQESGGLLSSGAQGVLSSISTQTISNVKTFDAIAARRSVENYYLKKAGSNQGISDSIMGIIQGVNGGGGMGGGFGGGGGGSKSSGGGSTATDSGGGGYSSGSGSFSGPR